MNDVVQPIYQHVGDFIQQHKAEVGSSPEVTKQLLQSLSQLIVGYMKLELADKRDHMIAEQAFKHECLRDARLRSIAQTYFDHLLEEMVELCKVIGVEDPEIAGELLMGTIFRIEHEALMIPVEQFDEDKACRIIKRQLSAFLP